MKKVKDLNHDKQLRDVKMRTKKGVIGYFHHMQHNIVFFATKRGDEDDGRLYPQVLGNNKDFLDWTVMDDDTPINCHMRTKIKDIDNT